MAPQKCCLILFMRLKQIGESIYLDKESFEHETESFERWFVFACVPPPAVLLPVPFINVFKIHVCIPGDEINFMHTYFMREQDMMRVF